MTGGYLPSPDRKDLASTSQAIDNADEAKSCGPAPVARLPRRAGRHHQNAMIINREKVSSRDKIKEGILVVSGFIRSLSGWEI
jgi:hypothetical protein